MKYLINFLLLMCFVTYTSGQMTSKKLSNGRLVSIKEFESKFVLPRNIDIWLPETYDKDSMERYSVLYMQDGQNLFDPAYSYGGTEWQVDETLSRLLEKDSIPKVIVVGIWNTSKRFLEYLPAKAFKRMSVTVQKNLEKEYNGRPVSDEYLQFMVKELKPYVDTHFRTKKDRKNTFVAGSSMGGLISMYALFEYPEVFYGAACISTHWPVSIKVNGPQAPKALLSYMLSKFPRQKCKIYFDHGTATLDSWYAPYQSIIDVSFRQHAPKNIQWLSKIYEGAEHNESSWQKRFGSIALWLMNESNQD